MANSITDLIRIIDRHNFQKNNCTIVQLQAKDPLSVEFIREIQLDIGLVTTKAGPFTWTRFDNWAEALNFYFQYHKHWIDARNLRNQLCATPISMNGTQFQDTMAGYVYEALGPKAQARVRELPVDGRPGLHHKLTSWS